jgi:hypothetical protein
MENDTNIRIVELEKKIDAIYQSVEQTRKYMKWTGIITLAVIVLPIIGLMFALPSFISTYTETINNLGI